MKVPWDRGGLRTYLVLLALALSQPGQRAIWWGVPLLALGLALQIYAKGSLRQNEVVSRAGPYRLIRHPFYTANLLIDESIALMSGWWPLVVLLPIWWLLVYWPVMRQEERRLCELFAEVYPEYQRRTSRLIPLRRPTPGEGPGFSWQNPNISADTVIPRALKLLSLPLIFFLWREIRTNGTSLLAAERGPWLWAAPLLAGLYGLAVIVTRHLRDQQRILPDAASSPGWRLAGALVLLAVAGSLHRLECESGILLTLAGGLAMGASVALYLGSARLRLAAEGVALAAAMVLCELPWLAVVPVLLYAALVLDQRQLGPSGRPELAAHGALLKSGYIALYHCIAAAGIAVATIKELL